MAKVFKMPESLDIDFKFLGGKYGIKDIAARSIGLVIALPFTGLVYSFTENKFWAFIVFLIPTIVGIYYGSKKVYDGSLTLLQALKLKHDRKDQTTTLYNTRLNGGAEVERRDYEKEEVYNYDEEIAELETKLYKETTK